MSVATLCHIVGKLFRAVDTAKAAWGTLMSVTPVGILSPSFPTVTHFKSGLYHVGPPIALQSFKHRDSQEISHRVQSWVQSLAHFLADNLGKS